MRLTGLLRERVEVVNRSQTGAEDSQGTPTWVDADPVVEHWSIQPRTSEDLTARPASRATYIGFAPFGTVATHKAKVVWRGQTFEVDGAPRRWPNPRTGAESHSEVDLVEIVE